MTTTTALSTPTPTPAIPFGPQLIGRIEKSLNAFLQRQLAGTGLEETQWVTLNLTAASNATLTRDQLVARVAGVLKAGDIMAQANIAALEAARLAEVRADGAVDLTDAGRAIVGRIRGASAEFTQKLWGDLPTKDIETAGRILGTILARADALL